MTLGQRPVDESEAVTVGFGSQLSEMVPPCATNAVTSVAAAGAEPTAAFTFGGQLITGAVVSLTRMVCEQLELLPQGSLAVHVRVIVLWQLEPGLLCVSVNCTVTDPAQLSVAVTVAGGGTSLKHW